MLFLEVDLRGWLIVAIISIALIFLFTVAFDSLYLIRSVIWRVFSSSFASPIRLLTDSSSILGICTLSDLDFVLKHMNNARFLREMDFARISFYIRSGVHKVVTSNKGNIMQTATSIRYRKPVPLFSAYKITTRLLYWEENAFYLEHQFVTLRDGFVCAVVLSQQKLIGMQTNEVVKMVVKSDENLEVPPPSEELAAWIQSMKISSEKLRKKL